MMNVRAVVFVSLAVTLGAHPLVAQELFRYRAYALESSVASVVTTSGARESDIRTSHTRPAILQQVDWRAPYVRSQGELADPVDRIRFSFYDDQLYQIVATYDRGRMEGLTTDDVIESVSATYGVPLLPNAGSALTTDVTARSTIVGQWDAVGSLLTVTRSGTFSPEFQLILISKSLDARARAAITEAARLDAQDAPQRELDRRRTEAEDAHAATQKARAINKPAFRP